MAYLFFPITTGIVKSRLVTTIPFLYENWKVSLEVYPTGFQNGCESILHMTISGNADGHGSRIPGIWTCQRDLRVFSSVNGNPNYANKPGTPLQVRRRYKIEVQQQTFKNDSIYSIHLNGITVFSITNTQPMVFQNVKVYISDPWHPAQLGKISNVMIRSAPGKNQSHIIKHHCVFSGCVY